MAKARIAPPRFIKQRLRREESLLDRRSTQSVVVNCYTSSNVSLKHTTRIDKGSPLKCLERILTPCCALVATRLRVGKWVISRFPPITPLYDFIALNTKNRIKGVMTNLKISQPLCNYCVLPFNSRFFLRFSRHRQLFASRCPISWFYLPLEELHTHSLSLSLSFVSTETVLHEGTALVSRYRYCCCCWRLLSILCIDSSLCTRVCASENSTWKIKRLVSLRQYGCSRRYFLYNASIMVQWLLRFLVLLNLNWDPSRSTLFFN